MELARSASKELDRLPERDFAAIRRKLQALSANPRPAGVEKLTGEDAWRVRVGDYRIVYTIDDPTRIVAVLFIDHRRNVYRRLRR